MKSDDFDRGYANEQLRRARHPFRRLVRNLYLRDVLADVTGATIDLGCGAGQLLQRLPAGSIGIEANPILVQHLREKGLEVFEGFADVDGVHIFSLPPRHFRTLVMSHLLEHFEDADNTMRAILRWAVSIGVRRVIAIVPGRRGFQSDATHKTFINRAYVDARHLRDAENFALISLTYFPGNFECLGNLLRYHEMKLVFDRQAS